MTATDIVARFRSFDRWHAWAAAFPEVFSPARLAGDVAAIRTRGIVVPLSGTGVLPGDIAIAHGNYRETVVAEGLLARHRAILFELQHLASCHNSALQKSAARIRVIGEIGRAHV